MRIDGRCGCERKVWLNICRPLILVARSFSPITPLVPERPRRCVGPTAPGAGTHLLTTSRTERVCSANPCAPPCRGASRWCEVYARIALGGPGAQGVSKPKKIQQPRGFLD